jgi:hypothetical protein
MDAQGGTAEHLLNREGLDEVGVTRVLETPWKSAKPASPLWARRTLGTGVGAH